MVGCITRTPHQLPPETVPPGGHGGRGTGDGETATTQRKHQGQAARGAVLRTLDISFEPWQKVNKRSERAATPLGAPQILSTGGLPNVYLRRSKQTLRKANERVNQRQLQRGATKRCRKTTAKSIKGSARKIKNNPPDPKGHGGKFFI